MSEKIEKRWYRWDKWMNEQKYSLVVQEFDKMVKDREKISIGDIVRKNQSLEFMEVEMLDIHRINKEK